MIAECACHQRLAEGERPVALRENTAYPETVGRPTQDTRPSWLGGFYEEGDE